MAEVFTLTFNAIGTLSADPVWAWTAPFDCTLIHVSAVGDGAAKAALTAGNSTDRDAYLAKNAIGSGGVPAEFDFDDFATYASKAYPRITDGTILTVDVDHDYNNGGASVAAADLTIVLTFLKG